MTWRLREILPAEFLLSLNDAYPEFNRYITSYEEKLFLNPRPDELVAIEKTQADLQGLSDEVALRGERVRLPRPFLFTLGYEASHPKRQEAGQKRPWTVVLYDNAGEQFLPGADSVHDPGTLHVAHAKAILFLFDPTKDPRFRARMRTDDPQTRLPTTERQVTLLAELRDRIARFRTVGPVGKHEAPLLVVVTKATSGRGSSEARGPSRH